MEAAEAGTLATTSALFIPVIRPVVLPSDCTLSHEDIAILVTFVWCAIFESVR